ncbi:hypothetical protein [Paraburkholderia sp. BCC1886]|uniref:hypothetical protein n=1 Tax=Paraburkholderia sp. BCC1886 TaxID=2562670 RepID=UPI001182722D|nr:hypothetical protein [Paraburkholderia sp. BCC1886]
MFNQSLNAGVDGLDFDSDLELVPQIVETIGTGVAPELDEELTALIGMEAAVEDLDTLRCEILSLCGMNQTLALEGMRLLPETFGGGAPIGYYSVQTSSTRLKLSLESIGKGVWALIAVGIAAVVTVLYKLFKWMSGGSKDLDAERKMEQRAKAFEEATETLEKAMKAFEKAQEDLKQSPSRLDPESQYATDDTTGVFTMQKVIDTFFMQDTLHQRVVLFLEQRDPVFHDIVQKGEYSKAMSKATTLFRDMSFVLKQRVALVKEIAEKDMTDAHFSGEKMINVRVLEQMAQPMQVEHDGHKTTMSQISSHLANLRAVAEAKKPEENLNFDKVFSTLYEAFAHSGMAQVLLEMRAVVPQMAELQGYLTHMQKQAERLSVDGAEGAHSQLIGHDLRHAIFVLGKDLADLGLLMSQVQYYTQHMSYLAVQCVGFGEEIAKKVVAHLRAENGKPPAAWEEVLSELRAYRARLQELHRRAA